MRDFIEILLYRQASDTYPSERLPAYWREQSLAPHNRYVSVNWLLET